MAKLYSYKKLIEVRLNKIFAKYARKDLTLVQFRQRIYSGSMDMEQALTKKPIPKPGTIENNRYLANLYADLKNKTERYVSKPRFILKMSNGFAPSEAIKNGNPEKDDGKDKGKGTKNIVKIATSIAKLRKQEKKEIIAEAKRVNKQRPFSKKEQKYIEHVDILNSAFGVVKSDK